MCECVWECVSISEYVLVCVCVGVCECVWERVSISKYVLVCVLVFVLVCVGGCEFL